MHLFAHGQDKKVRWHEINNTGCNFWRKTPEIQTNDSHIAFTAMLLTHTASTSNKIAPETQNIIRNNYRILCNLTLYEAVLYKLCVNETFFAI